MTFRQCRHLLPAWVGAGIQRGPGGWLVASLLTTAGTGCQRNDARQNVVGICRRIMGVSSFSVLAI